MMANKNVLQDRSNNPLASIIIINLNNYAMTKQCIESILQKTKYSNYEIVLVDNGSVDNSFQKLKKEFLFVKTIRNDKNYGFPYALNQGYRDSKGFYLAPINNDAIVLNDWLTNAINVLKSDKLVAVAGCTEVSQDSSKNKRQLKKLTSLPNVEKMTLPVAWVTTRKMIDEIGYLDTEFFSPIYGEEADWNFRARKIGYKIIRASGALVVHSSSHDTKKILGNKKQFILINFHRHRAMLFNLSFFELLRFMPGLSMIFLTSIFNGTFFWLLKSYWLTLKDLKLIIEQRKKNRLFVEFKEPKFTEII